MPEAIERPGAGRDLLLPLAAALLIAVVLGSSATIFNDGDVSWHIATGRWILEHGAIPKTDPFSYTWAGKPWVPMEWLSDAAEAAVFRLAGHGGVAALVTAALVALHGLVFFNAMRFVRPWPALLTVAAMDVVLIPMMLARPHLFVWAIAALWLWLLLRAREEGRAPPLAAALLMTIWANVHGSFLIGLAIAAAFGLEALVAGPDRRRAFTQWLLFGVACAIAVLINPNGIAGIVYPFHLANLAMLPLIDEWKPSSPAVTPFFFAVLAAVLVLLAIKRPRIAPVRLALLALLLGLSLWQMRHQAMLAIVAAMLLPTAFKQQAEREARGRAAFLFAAAGVVFVLLRAAMPMAMPYNAANPWPLIARVPTNLRGQPVLNGYSMGGPLILSGIRPFIDGRSDMYGDAFVLAYKRISDGDPAALAAAERQWRLRWAIVPLDSKTLVGLLDHAPGWRRIYADRVGAIYVRDV